MKAWPATMTLAVRSRFSPRIGRSRALRAKSVNVVYESTASSIVLITYPAATRAGITSSMVSPSITVMRAFASDSALM